jgi:ATP-dependent helicase Lhr and Lhr-like helicase
VSGFDRLNSAVQHHIVNSLGWPSLRPLQELSIDPVLDGKHCLLLAPTAGGKTEAAILPILSSMVTQNWQGLSVLYICPIKALLNDLHTRLDGYCRLLGRSCGIWHGDVSASVKKRLVREPPDCLLMTPESLEVILVSNATDHRALLSGVRVAIVDEIHAFAGDDRGWHLLSVLERISRIAEHPVQRIGLSATVGNPDELLDWYVGSQPGERVVVQPPASEAGTPADVQLDYVGSLDNAAIVISRLHRGEKRLVFVDSRASTEKLAARLRELGVETFVSHSSLSADERRRAEEAFKTATGCVIVATSTLELGIDVGDLDRVIQIDAPGTVASFLQRLGRTGRRQGTARNCLFLATREASLIQAAALLSLWEDGYVEPIVAPPEPYHIFAQQLMALALQEHGIGQRDWQAWLTSMPGFSALSIESLEAVVAYMLSEGILFADGGVMWLGDKGEEAFGYRNFMDLLSVFTSPPVFMIKHGTDEIGSVQQANFYNRKEDEAFLLLLSGRCWRVVDIEWSRKVAHVVPADQKGVARWRGPGVMLPFTLCQAMKRVLVSEDVPSHWAERARIEMGNQRDAYSFLRTGHTSLVHQTGDNRTYWWTFAGMKVNTLLAFELQTVFHGHAASADNLAVEIDGVIPINELTGVLPLVVEHIQSPSFVPPIIQEAIDGLKFSACLPETILQHQLGRRTNDLGATMTVLEEPVNSVVRLDD